MDKDKAKADAKKKVEGLQETPVNKTDWANKPNWSEVKQPKPKN